MDLLGLGRAVRLPAATPPAASPAVLMNAVRHCSHDHEEVTWQGTPASACWVCDWPCNLEPQPKGN